MPDVLRSVRPLDAQRFVHAVERGDVETWSQAGPLRRLRSHLGDRVVEILTEHADKPVHVPGAISHPCEIYSWEALERFLTCHRPNWPRLRLARAGEALAPSRYLHTTTTQRDGVVTALNAKELIAELRDGATLVVDAVEESEENLRQLCDDLAYVVGVLVQANAYGSLQALPGFGLHWDDHDALVVQLSGAKTWMFSPPTRDAPLRGEEDLVPPPKSPLEHRVRLEPGDILFLPRGWWHEATATAETSLHVTLALPFRTFVDLIHWSTALRAQEDPLLRMNVLMGPLARAGVSDAGAYGWNYDADLVATYEGYQRARMLPRPRVSLPWSGRQLEAWPADIEVKSRLPQPLTAVRSQRDIALYGCGMELVVNAEHERTVRACLAADGADIRALAGTADASYETLRQVVEELLVEGLISLS